MNILLVDDDNHCLEGLVTVLEPAGYRCDAFTDPRKAVEAFDRSPYDLVITDMKMPGMNGIQVIKEIRSIAPEVRIIIVTGFGDVDSAISAVNNGAYAFYGKPVDFAELMETIEKIESEIRDGERVKAEHAKLAMEYVHLKQAYDDLKKLLKDSC